MLHQLYGYNYGADNKEELKNVFKRSMKIIGIMSLLLTALAEILSKMLASIFVSYDTELLQLTTHAIRIFSISFLFCGFNIFTSAFFTALNNGVISAIISFLRTLLFQIGTILLLPLIIGVDGIWEAVIIAELLALGVSIICIIKNKQKYQYI